eukprot:scaffold25411_cov152-Cylindrotheca_fusiformis.AAC.6
MAHVLQYIGRKVSRGTRKASQQVYSLFASTRDEDPVISSPLVASEEEGGGSGYGTSDEEESRQPQTSIGFTDRYVDWTHSKDSIFKAEVASAVYIAGAIILYSFVLEDWPILDSVYFAVTVYILSGYGDLSPTNDISRLCTVVFASSGIVILGVFLGIVGTRLFEVREERANEKIQTAQKQVLKQFKPHDSQSISEQPPRKPMTFLDHVWEIFKVEAPIILLLMLLASPVVYLEGWDPIMGFYWMFVTGTTIGFGDLSPTHEWTKVICIIYVPLSAAVFGEMLAQIAGAYIERSSQQLEDAFMARALTKADIDKMDVEKDGKVKPYEFLCFMLVTMQKVEQEEIDEILEVFRKLDKDQNGYLNQDDLSNKQNLEARLNNVTAPSPNYTSLWD